MNKLRQSLYYSRVYVPQELYVFMGTNDLLLLFLWGQTYFLFERRVWCGRDLCQNPLFSSDKDCLWKCGGKGLQNMRRYFCEIQKKKQAVSFRSWT